MSKGIVLLPRPLTTEEVISVRLYTGPAYQPINGFLRQIANLSGEHRTRLARDVRLTYACTVRHVCDGIRKLAAVATAEELAAPLYRGVRGELPNAFWFPDEQGMVIATDAAFMSTSVARETRKGRVCRKTHTGSSAQAICRQRRGGQKSDCPLRGQMRGRMLDCPRRLGQRRSGRACRDRRWWTRTTFHFHGRLTQQARSTR